MSFGRFLVPSAFFCCLTSYGTYKYLEMKRANLTVEQAIKNGTLTDFLFRMNEGMAFTLDSTLDNYEIGSKILDYRKTIAKYVHGRVLQTCVGTSRNAKFFPHGLDVTFIDWSPNMIEAAMTKTYPFLKSTKFVLGNVRSMPFQDNQFDSVIDTFGLEAVEAPMQALLEIERVCKKDGTIVLMANGMPGVIQFHSYHKFKAGIELLKSAYFCDRKWDEIIKESQLQIVASERKAGGSLYVYVLKNNKPHQLLQDKTASDTATTAKI